MSRAWFKFYGRDFRDGVRDLPWEVTGIYSVLLTLLYEQADGRIKDHDQRLSRLIGCDIRLWKRARAALIEMGKLSLTQDGFLANQRCSAEVSDADLGDSYRTSSAQVREMLPIAKPQLIISDAPKPLKQKPPDIGKAPLTRAIESEPESETPSLRSGVSRPRQPQTTSKRFRINSELELSDVGRDFAANSGFLNGSAEGLWDRFKNHHDAKGTLFANVEAGWRTWVLNEIKFQGERHVDGFGASGNRSGGARSGSRSQPRSAATIIMERALEDELDGDPIRFGSHRP